jgi:hypothetical protein
MEEIKRRNRTITEALSGSIPPQPQIIVSEICYLQLRLLCELIILGCAVAQGELADLKAKRIKKTWHAAELAAKLQELHPDFYPVPGAQVLGGNGKVERLETVKGGFLTLAQLRTLYAECGDRLHVGSLERVLNDRRPNIDLNRIRWWQDLIVRLLNHHQIQLYEPNFQLWTIMQANSDGRVHVTLFERIGPAPQ